MKTRLLLLFTWILFFLIPAVVGQPRSLDDRKWEFSLFGGANSLQGANSFLTGVADGSTNRVSLDTASSWAMGLRVGENLNQFVAFDLEYNFANVPSTFTNLSPDLPIFPIDQHVHNFSYSGVFHLRNRRSSIRPFVLIGGGGSYFSVSGGSVDDGLLAGFDLKSRWKFAFNWGLGAKFKVTERWGLRVDFRDNITGVPDYGFPREAPVNGGVQGVGFRPEGQFHHYLFTAGFIYYFAYR